MTDALEPYGPVLESTVRVATWNVWARFGPWEAREAGLLAELRRTDPDVIALQEAWAVDGTSQTDRFAEALGLHGVPAADSVAGRDSHVAVLSRWPLLHHDRLVFEPVDGGDGGGALFVRVDGPRGPLDVVSLILDWRLDLSRVRAHQLTDICAWAKELGDPFTPLLLCGDFNAPPDSDELRRLVGLGPPHVPRMVFYDSWAAAGEGRGATHVTRNPFGAVGLLPDRRIDHIFSQWPKAHGAGHPVRAELLGDGPHDGVWPSDHLGVVADLRY